MALVRGFGAVDEEGGFTIPLHLRRFAGFCFKDKGVVAIKVLRLKGTARLPYLVIHTPGQFPYIAVVLEAVMLEGAGLMDEGGRVVLSDEICEEAKIKPKDLLEIKIHGSKRLRWVKVHNRGPHRRTTLQEKMGRVNKEIDELKWFKKEWNY